MYGACIGNRGEGGAESGSCCITLNEMCIEQEMMVVVVNARE